MTKGRLKAGGPFDGAGLLDEQIVQVVQVVQIVPVTGRVGTALLPRQNRQPVL